MYMPMWLKVWKWFLILVVFTSWITMPALNRKIIKYEQERGLYRNAEGEIK